MLILDEATSGVDPIPCDSFWQYLISLSRDDGVTIFLSTHFVNEGERRDRISLMHAAKFLACQSVAARITSGMRSSPTSKSEADRYRSASRTDPVGSSAGLCILAVRFAAPLGLCGPRR